MKRFSTWLLLASLLAAPAFAASEDEAGDVSEVDKDASGPLRDRVRPVSGHLFLMDGRFEVSPGINLSLRDAFWQKVGFGAALTYHFTEQVAVSAKGAYNLSLISGAAQICDPVSGNCSAPTFEELTTQNGQPSNVAYGYMSLLTSVDLQWAPLYGKLALFAEKVLNFNMYVLAGPTFLMYGPTNTFTVGGNVGVGFRFFLNKWLTVRLELRDVIYYEQGARIGDNQLDSVRNQLMAELGFSMFFPTVFSDVD
ncbi:MAG TPA: outer membrane beta-barrel domain-containing protein [Archangium sp.]